MQIRREGFFNRMLPLVCLALPCLYMPGVRLTGRIAYAAIASQHRRLAVRFPVAVD
jgi:hypothetical protein